MAKGPIFTRIKNNSIEAAQQAITWFKAAIQRISGSAVITEIDNEDDKTQEKQIDAAQKSGLLKPIDTTNIGQMFLFKYDAKYKDKLPYFDEFPLVFPIGTFSGGFTGINLHYLPFGFRAPILNHLGELTSDDKYDDETKLEISYEILKDSTIFFDRFYKDCIKKYLYTHVRSQFYYVSPSDWHNVAVLPFERWSYKK